MIRSISVIGSLWPLCKSCGHIAQQHNFHKDDNRTGECCNQMVTRQCEHCGAAGITAKCLCHGYDGPTFEQFKETHLTAEEIAHYRY